MLWWIVATICAYFVKGLCGFANTLVFSTIMSFGTSNINISPVELMLGWPSNMIIAWKERKSIRWSICIPTAALIIAGSVPGAFFLKNADTGVIKIFFGFVIILIGLQMLVQEFRQKKARQSKAGLIIIGIFSGILCGLYGIGAMLGAYLGQITDDSSSFKANMCTIFVFENTFRVILYIMNGILTFAVLKRAFVLFPFMLLGLVLGMQSGKVLDEKLIKKIVIVMLIISGVALVVNSL